MSTKKKQRRAATRPRNRGRATLRPPQAIARAERRPPHLKFSVVGICASAGGLAAFKTFFAAMPADSGMAFVLIPHLDPTHASLMVELVSRQTAMKVCEAAEGAEVEPNCVYVIPPNKYLSLILGHLHLTKSSEQQRHQTAIDPFLFSLAEDQREKAIGIVLSGTGSNGTPGLKEIKLAGGLTVAQDPETAEYDQMPRSAIDAGIVDYVLPTDKMPEALINSIRRPRPTQPLAVQAEGAAGQINRILDLLNARTKYDFHCYRKNMLLRRVQRRMALCHLNEISAYLPFLLEHPDEVTALSRDLLIGVTCFFREPEAFQVLKQKVIPELVERQTGEIPVRAWVPACASGEEAYSIAILLLEQFTAGEKPVRLQVFATDIDEESLETARHGIYTARTVSELSPDRLRQFFIKLDEDHYQVNKLLRGSIVVTRQNVISDPVFSKVDLICCRNLLIYLEPELQNKLMSLFHFALNERGHLVLGRSESIGRRTDVFAPLSAKWRVYRRIDSARRAAMQASIVAIDDRRKRAPRGELIRRPPMGFPELMQKVLAKHALAAVLIDRKFEILSLFGPTSNYLQLPTGEPTKDLLAMAPQELRTKIRAACHKVLTTNDALSATDARIVRNGSSVRCTIRVSLLHEPDAAEGLLLVIFQDSPEQVLSAGPHHPGTEEESAVIQQLEYEVKITREDLQSTIEELRTSNEDVMSINEELQSANEELESSKEELQSFNEELSTVNSQLQDKVEELESANNDIRNLFNSTEIATVFLDQDLRIRRFTPAIAQLLNLTEGDVGRPMRDFSLRFIDKSLMQDAGRVLDTLAPVETEVRTEEGHWYLRRILPYRTGDGIIHGVAITFVNITERVATEAQARLFTTVLRDSNDAVMVQNLDGQITAWNRGAEKMYGYTATEALQLRSVDLVPPDEQAAHEESFKRIADGEELQSFETRRLTKHGSLLDVWLTVTRLADDRGNPIGIATTERDVTELKRAHSALLSAQSLVSLGTLTAGIAHEINNPAGAALLAAETALSIASRRDPTDQVVACLQTIVAAMARCGVTVRNILNLSRNDPGEQTTCQLNQIVSRVCDVLSPYADQRRTTIRPQFADGLPPIFANPLEIEILLINLARNAIESKDEEAQVTIRTSGGDGRVHLSVSDDGCGMTAEEIKRIFEPCYTTRQDSGGTGIGMSIVERILQNHGASIAIDSTPGVGTTIRIDFPAHSAPT
jgi:two-component system, chemotaxis family, CheB/CheR fusion protein